MISIESMVARARCLRYKRDYMTPGKYSVIKPTAMEKLMQFPAKIHTVMV